MGILPNLFPENAHPFLQSESYIPVCLLSCPCEDVQTLFRCMPHHTGFHPVFVQIDLIYSQDLTSSHPAPFLKFFLRERKGIPEGSLRQFLTVHPFCSRLASLTGMYRLQRGTVVLCEQMARSPVLHYFDQDKTPPAPHFSVRFLFFPPDSILYLPPLLCGNRLFIEPLQHPGQLLLNAGPFRQTFGQSTVDMLIHPHGHIPFCHPLLLLSLHRKLSTLPPGKPHFSAGSGGRIWHFPPSRSGRPGIPWSPGVHISHRASGDSPSVPPAGPPPSSPYGRSGHPAVPY